MSWLERLREIKGQSSLSTREIADKSGLPEPTLEKLFSGQTKNPGINSVQQLVHALGYTLDDIDDKSTKKAPSELSEEAKKIARSYDKMTDHGKGAVRAILEYEMGVANKQATGRQKFIPIPKTKRSHGITEITVFDEPAAAGLGNPIDTPPSHIEQYPSDYVPSNTNFGVLISGDSMEPKIPDGSTVFVQAAPVLDSGEIGIFILDGQSYCKQLMRDEETQQVKLHSFNPEYDDIEIPPFSELRVIGRVLGGYDPKTREII